MSIPEDKEIAGMQLLKLISDGKDVGATVRKNIRDWMFDRRYLNVKTALINTLRDGLQVNADMTLGEALEFLSKYDKKIETIAQDIEREIATQ